jgi:MSHA biogenesis protein MshI
LKEVKDIVTALNVDNLKVASITTEEFAFANLVTAKKDAVLLVCAQPKEEIVLIIVKNGQLFFHRRLRGFTQIADKSPEELDMGNIDSLSLEIQRSTDYFERQLKQASIKEILVLVPMDNEAYLARRLADNTNVPVNLLTLPALYSEHRENACALGATMQADKENA